EEFHIFQRDAVAQANGCTVAGEGVGIGGDFPAAPPPAGSKEDGFAVENVEITCCQFNSDHAAHCVADTNQVNDMKLVEEIHVIAHALLVKRLQNHVPGAVGGVAGAGHGSVRFVVGV